MTIRVVLGDDNVLVREGVRALLSMTDGIEVVGVAEDAPTLLAAAAEYLPDVVVTDIKMPPNFRLEGIDCALEIRSRHPDTGVVVLSAHDDEEYALALLGGGESGLGYLLKDRMAEGDELSRAIHEVHAGGSMVDPTIAARLSESRKGGEEDRANPNGSLRAIAGVTNAAGNVAGLMPHPETAVEAVLGSDDGLGIIASFVASAAERERASGPPAVAGAR